MVISLDDGFGNYKESGVCVSNGRVFERNDNVWDGVVCVVEFGGKGCVFEFLVVVGGVDGDYGEVVEVFGFVNEVEVVVVFCFVVSKIIW